MPTFDVNLDKVVSYLNSDIDWSGGDGESVMYEFYQNYPEYDPEKHDNVKEPPKTVFNQWFDGWVRDLAWQVIDDIEGRVGRDGTINIWREITAPKNWHPASRKHIGVYWSWDKHAAHAHWGSFKSGHVKWLLGAIAHVDQVDWNSTIALNLNPSLGSEEKEIRLYDNVEIVLVSLEKEGRAVDVEKYAERKFAANRGAR